MNPIIPIMQMMSGGNNQQMMFQQLINKNQLQGKGREMAMNAFRMFQSGDTQGLQNLANNLAQTNNTSVEEMKNKIMNEVNMM